jgi:hypothetical protein
MTNRSTIHDLVAEYVPEAGAIIARGDAGRSRKSERGSRRTGA